MRSRATPHKAIASRDDITLAVGVRTPAGHFLGCGRDTMLAGQVSEKVGNAVVGSDWLELRGEMMTHALNCR